MSYQQFKLEEKDSSIITRQIKDFILVRPEALMSKQKVGNDSCIRRWSLKKPGKVIAMIIHLWNGELPWSHEKGAILWPCILSFEECKDTINRYI